VQQAREAARRTQCKNNLRQIGLALYNYNEVYGTFPPAYVADAAGKPMHSWRVLILPYIDELPLYQQYHFDEPWDGPNNSRLMSRMPRLYACPSDPNPGSGTNTAYAGVFGEKCVFRGGLPVRISEITDGASNTLLVGEAAGAGIPWMKPDDIDFAKHSSLGDSAGFSSHHQRGVIFLFCDGAVKFIASDVNPATLQGASTRNGDEMPGNF
jgi:prepilin-type processing-associated H-X9-DG protein